MNNELFVHTACLLSGVIVHGSVPEDLLIGTTIPIPKGKHGNATSSDNYRGITLSSIMGGILDSVILIRYSSDLQFGFKRKRSTAMCSMFAKEVILHYTNHGSNVSAVFLGASKAFEKVHCNSFFQLV
jgi:hypothetical protein